MQIPLMTGKWERPSGKIIGLTIHCVIKMSFSPRLPLKALNGRHNPRSLPHPVLIHPSSCSHDVSQVRPEEGGTRALRQPQWGPGCLPTTGSRRRHTHVLQRSLQQSPEKLAGWQHKLTWGSVASAGQRPGRLGILSPTAPPHTLKSGISASLFRKVTFPTVGPGGEEPRQGNTGSRSRL